MGLVVRRDYPLLIDTAYAARNKPHGNIRLRDSIANAQNVVADLV